MGNRKVERLSYGFEYFGPESIKEHAEWAIVKLTHGPTEYDISRGSSKS